MIMTFNLSQLVMLIRRNMPDKDSKTSKTFCKVPHETTILIDHHFERKSKGENPHDLKGLKHMPSHSIGYTPDKVKIGGLAYESDQLPSRST